MFEATVNSELMYRDQAWTTELFIYHKDLGAHALHHSDDINMSFLL